MRDGQIFGMGNPLLDMQCTADAALLEKYKLKSNDAILAGPEHAPLFEELKKRENVEYIPGGATQNSMRVAQWVLQRPNTTTFMGSVGKDDYASILSEKARAAGVNVQYYNTDVKTGTCGVLITGHDRSLVADLAAANEYKIDHLKLAENEKLMKDADLYYISGFFLTVSPPSLMHVAQHAHETGKVFSMNLSAPFLCQFFKDPQVAALEYCDIIFGNETEAAEFATQHSFGTTDVAEIAAKLAAWPKKNAARPRLAVITQGKDEVICVQDGQTRRYPV
jgi:adenosine kinase